MYWLIALQKQYEADIAEHTAVLKTFVNNSVGVADHDKFMSILKDRVNKLSHAKDSLKTVQDIIYEINFNTRMFTTLKLNNSWNCSGQKGNL